MTGVTWIHLSDWHQKGKDFDRIVVLRALLKDIRQRTEISPDLEKINFIVFSGDVAYSGKSDEYKAAKELFFQPLLNECGLKPEQLFIVPGNHDLDRDKFDMLPGVLTKPLSKEKDVQDWLTDDAKRARLLEPFEEYASFAREYTKQDPPNYINVKRIKVEEIEIALLGLNSAWMCGRNRDKIGDKGFVIIGEPQIDSAIEDISTADLRIAVLHHPFDWLAEFDCDRVEVPLKQGCDFVLRGHQHKPRVGIFSGTSGECVIIPAGASYDRRMAENPRYVNSYNIVHLDFNSKKGAIFLRRWSDPRNKWIEDVDSCTGGKFEFNLFESNPKASTAQETPTAIVNIPHQIPQPPADFTGRNDDLKYLLDRFNQGATITGLRGMGGIGKTALAFMLAEKLIDRYPDGQILVNMNGTSDEPLTASDAMAQIIHAYDIDARLPPIESELSGLYRSMLHNKKVLILLDNVANEDQVRPLLSSSSCGFIVTSREKFTLPGLIEKDLNVMLTPDACALLIKIASRIGDHAEELAKLCGYLPLALRAASSLLANERDLPIAQYLTELRNERTRLERIGGEGVDLDVEASFNLSYRRLKSDEAHVFRLLSIFPADFDANAEDFLCKDKGHKRLSKLVRWSLVDFYERESRYRLHDLTRIFAAKSLLEEEGETARSTALHRYFVRYLSVLLKAHDLYEKGGESTALGLEILDRELDNIQAGLAWAERNAKLNTNAAALCISYANSASVLSLRLHPHNLIRWFEVSLEAAKQLNKPKGECVILTNMGISYFIIGEIRKAIGLYEQALVINRQLGRQKGEGITLAALGNAYEKLGEVRKAIKYYNQALEIGQKTRNKKFEGSVLGDLGIAFFHLGKIREATEFHEQAHKISCKIGNLREEGAELGNLGVTLSHLGEISNAIKLYEKALAIAREIGDRRGEANQLDNIGNAYSDLGEPQKAIEFYEQALVISKETGDRTMEGEYICNLGRVNLELNEFKKTIDYCMQSLEIVHKIEYRKIEAQAICILGRAFTAQDEPQKALGHCDSALKIFQEIEYPKGEAEALFARSQALHRLGQHEEATSCAQQALAIFQRIESPLAEKVSQQLAEWGSPQET